jgi:hypothetical protein
LQLGPGERAEIVVAFTQDDDVVLRSFEQDVERQIGGNDTFDLIRFRTARSLKPSPSLADDLGSSGETPSVPDDARVRRQVSSSSAVRTIRIRPPEAVARRINLAACFMATPRSNHLITKCRWSTRPSRTSAELLTTFRCDHDPHQNERSRLLVGRCRT